MSTATQRDFPRMVWDQITRSVREFIETESLVIHPDYREVATVAIRYTSGEAVFVDKTREEAQAIGDQIAHFWGGLSVHDEIQARARAHALSIAQAALEMRKNAFARARAGRVPKQVYTNPNPKQVRPTRQRATLLRVV